MRIESLTFLRFLAALVVVIYHFGKSATGLTGFWTSGPEMVTFFFVLSGFVMAIAYGDRDRVLALPYIWARLSRLVPVYWFALALVVIPQCLRGSRYGMDVATLGLNATLLQSWWPGIVPINFPGWSLSVELFFYLAFPWLLIAGKRGVRFPWAILAGGLLVWALVQVAIAPLLTGPEKSIAHLFADYSPISHFPSFVIGVLGGLHFQRRGWTQSSGLLASVGALLSGSVLVVILNHPDAVERALGMPIAFRSSFLSPLYMVLIFSVAACRWRWTRWLGWGPLVLLGKASYSFYILQLPIFQLHVMYLRPRLHMGERADFLIFVAVLILASLLTHRYMETPANTYLRSKAPFFLTRLKRPV